jgi:hypothetical protein
MININNIASEMVKLLGQEMLLKFIAIYLEDLSGLDQKLNQEYQNGFSKSSTNQQCQQIS